MSRLDLPGLLLALGEVEGVSHNYKFGYNDDVGSGAQETVSDLGGLIAYPSSAAQVKVSSSSGDDAAAGTGALTVQVYGLDASWDEQDEVVTLTGQTAVLTLGSYVRINRMVVRSAGSGGANAGIVYVGAGAVASGVPAIKYCAISVGENQTLHCSYTVPNAKRGLLQRVIVSTFGNQNAFITGRLVAHPPSEVWQTKDRFTVTRGEVEFTHSPPVVFAAKTDLEIRAQSSGADLDVSAAMDLVLVDI